MCKESSRQKEQQAQKHCGKKKFGSSRNLEKACVAGSLCINSGAAWYKISNVAVARSIKTS